VGAQIVLFCRWASLWPADPVGRQNDGVPGGAWGGAPMTAPAYARAVGSHRDLIRLATVVQDIDRTARSCAVRGGQDLLDDVVPAVGRW